MQIEEYEQNVTEQMHQQRQYYESTITKIVKTENEKISEKKKLVQQLRN